MGHIYLAHIDGRADLKDLLLILWARASCMASLIQMNMQTGLDYVAMHSRICRKCGESFFAPERQTAQTAESCKIFITIICLKLSAVSAYALPAMMQKEILELSGQDEPPV